MSGDFFTRKQAQAEGMSDARLGSSVRSGSLTRISHGVLTHTGTWTALAPMDQYRVRVRAAAERVSNDGAVSHQSAAALHGLAMLRPDLTSVHFTVHGSGGGHRAERILHRVRLKPQDTTSIDGLLVTTVARTAADVACTGNFDQAVCVMESALRAGASIDALADAVRGLGKRKGIAVARRALTIVDGRTESIGESWSRAQMVGWPDIPMPRLQHEFRTPAGLFVARTDFDWDGKLAGEFDGRIKYRGGATEAVIAERQREVRLQALGVHVVRWTWDDLRRPGQLRRILRDGLNMVGL